MNLSSIELRQLANLDWGVNDLNSSSLALQQSLLDKIDSMHPEDNPAIMFSGGVDSALIVAALMNLGKDPVLYTFDSGNTEDLSEKEGNDDISSAIKCADALGLEIVKARWPGVENIQELVARHQASNAHELALRMVEDAVLSYAQKDGHQMIWTGGGIDATWAGGRKESDYEGSTLTDKQISFRQEQLKLWYWVSQVNFTHPPEFLFPAMDYCFYLLSAQTSFTAIFSGGFDKSPVRLAAKQLGIPEENAYRSKTAAQRGSQAFAIIYELILADADKLTDLKVAYKKNPDSVNSFDLITRLGVSLASAKNKLEEKFADEKKY
jgi:hypothetical protein